MVLKMVVNYARQHSGQNALRTMVGPLIERVCFIYYVHILRFIILWPQTHSVLNLDLPFSGFK